MPFSFQRLEIPDLILIRPVIFEDHRGYFMELYREDEFFKAGITQKFVQDNFSFSKKNVLRGLHFQRKPYEQSKIVRCIRGKILDVVVDLRPNSPTFKRHVKIILSDENKQMLFIPKGFAHGFLVLSESAEVEYKVDEHYKPEYDCGVVWNDTDLKIDWPIKNPIISEKDAKLPTLKELMERGWI